MTAVRSVVLGVGAYLPQKVLTNDDIARIVDTSDDWIQQRTGIRERHIAAEGEFTSDLAVAAAKAALANANLEASDIDMIVMATATPDNTFPAAAVSVQEKLGITRGSAFDVQAVCSGFIYALTTADALIRTGHAEKTLVIGAETFSRLLDWTDRTTCVLFGDGAGAVVLGRTLGSGTTADRGLLSSHLRSDGRYKEKLYVDGGPSSTGTVGHLRMEGREVYKHAIAKISDVLEDAFLATGVTAADIDWFVPHQANVRIIDATAEKFGIPSERVIRTVDRHGNTSAASIPLALAEAAGDGRIKSGDLLLLEAMGGGFTLGRVDTALVMNAVPALHVCNATQPTPAYRLILPIAPNRLSYWLIRENYAFGGAIQWDEAMAGKTVTRADLCEAVYQTVGLSRTESADLVELVLDEITASIVRGEAVKLSSFGSFVVRKKGERVGRNPKTGEEVPISPRRVMVFKPSNVLKQRINEVMLNGGGTETEGGAPTSSSGTGEPPPPAMDGTSG